MIIVRIMNWLKKFLELSQKMTSFNQIYQITILDLQMSGPMIMVKNHMFSIYDIRELLQLSTQIM